MKIAIVGATGFLGSNFLRYASVLRPDLRILALHRPGRRIPDGPNVVPVQIDLDAGEMPSLDANVAIYCAGVSDHGLGFAKTADSSVRLARFLDGFRGHLVLLSSGAVYYDGKKGPIAEDVQVAPTMPYGVAKHLEEQVAVGAAASGRLSELAILRLFYAYGQGERPSRLVRRAIDVALAGGGEIEIPEGAPSVIHPVHVDDLARWVFRMLDAPGRGIETLNLAGPAAMPLDEVVAAIARAMGADLRVRRAPRAEAFPVHYWSDDARQRARGLLAAPFEASIRTYAAEIAAGGKA
ncbi:MAG: NAD(P)-dependent oxidoreductase [Proteobacteria bacterium]|nr:NAD(P)-dependent oxidoreductase [Pseudomonadota bacterium]